MEEQMAEGGRAAEIQHGLRDKTKPVRLKY
jgi:hypothetical protein